MQKNYYEILGVDKTATNDDIKKAFRKLSVKWHPDKWANKSESERKEAEDKFKEINEANSVLSDTEKRRNYDQFGDPNGRPNSIFDDLRDFDINDSFFSNFSNRGNRNTVKKGDDCYVDVNITLEEVFNGGIKTINYTKKKACSECNGSGISKDGKKETCSYCNGTGVFKNVSRNGYMTYVQQGVCPHCNGLGYKITKPCKKCNGSGLENSNNKIDINVPIGIFNGAQMKIDMAGDAPFNNDGINGDLIITFIEDKHQKFIRNGDNIVSNLELTIYEALCGKEVTTECIDGTKVKFKIPKLTQDGRVFRFANKGLRNLSQNSFRGDHLINVVYKYPKELTKRQEELLKEFCDIQEK